MMALPPDLCRAAYNRLPPRADMRPLQLGCHGCPWKVAIASILLNRTRRSVADSVFADLLTTWPDPESMCRAEGMDEVLKPLGLWRNRSRRLAQLCLDWLEKPWKDMRELPGVGTYVADAVSLFCFGDTDLVCDDGPLRKHAAEHHGPRLYKTTAGSYIVQFRGFTEFVHVQQALEAFRGAAALPASVPLRVPADSRTGT